VTEQESDTTGEYGLVFTSTRRYAPPEIVGQERPGRSADLFSLGCLFYKMILEILCMESHAIEEAYLHSLESLHNFTLSMRDHCSAAEGLRIPRSHIRRLSDLILQMTQKDPHDRPTAADVADGLGSNPGCWPAPEDPA
jgi:serine/threonine protein kinase